MNLQQEAGANLKDALKMVLRANRELTIKNKRFPYKKNNERCRSF